MIHDKKETKTILLAIVVFIALLVVACILRFRSGRHLQVRSFLKWSEHFSDRFKDDAYDVYGYDGIDVSKHNGYILWNEVAANKNVRFVYVRATLGDRIADRRYTENLRDARAAGLLVGSYHFFTSKSSATMQFLNFRSHASVGEQDLVPVVDVEEGGIGSRWSREQLQDSVAVFAALVKKHYGKLPVIYSNEHYYNTMLAPRFNNHYLFIANYSGRQPEIDGGGKANLWQYTERGHIHGVGERVDLSRFVNGTELEKLLLHE